MVCFSQVILLNKNFEILHTHRLFFYDIQGNSDSKIPHIRFWSLCAFIKTSSVEIDGTWIQVNVFMISFQRRHYSFLNLLMSNGCLILCTFKNTFSLICKLVRCKRWTDFHFQVRDLQSGSSESVFLILKQA